MQKKLHQLFWPIFIELFFFALMGTADTLMLSNYSDYASAAVGNANTILGMFMVMINIVVSGVAVVMSQYLGAKHETSAKKTLGTSLILNVLIGMMLGLLLFFLTKPLLQMVNTEIELFEYSRIYMKWLSLSVIAVAFSNTVAAALRTYGKPGIVTYVVISANIFNVIGNYVLIYGKLGLPALGVEGAAISTLISRILIVITYIIILKRVIGLELVDFKWSLDHTKRVVRIGLPAALENWTYTAMQVFLLSIVNSYGAQYTAARTYVNVVLSYIMITSLAFAAANIVLVGYALGEKKPEVAKKQTLKTASIGIAVSLVLVMLLNIVGPSFFKLFTDDPVVLDLMKRILWIFFITETGRTMNLVFIQALRAAGDTGFPLIMALISMLGIGAGLGYLFGQTLGMALFGVYLAMALDEIVRGISMLIRWLSSTWQKRQVIEF